MTAGYFDLQVNGAGGVNFTAADLRPDQVAAVAATLRAHGTTQFLPTLITAAGETVTAALRALEASRSDPALAAAIPGYHLEGPYISPLDGPRGAHPVAHVRPPDFDEMRRWNDAAGGRIRLVTLAPERPGAMRLIERLVAEGVRVALGHTEATTAELSDAASAGATLSTHLGNGCAAVLPRHPNPIWDQLADDRLAASVIADGHHLPPSVLRAVVRCKPAGRVIVVSDSSPLAGLPPGEYPLWGQTFVVRADGAVTLPGTGYLAGAGTFQDVAVNRLVTLGIATPAEAAVMAGDGPRRYLGLDRADRRESAGPAPVPSPPLGGEG